MAKSNMNDHNETCLFENKDKERFNIALKMFKDGVAHKIIERYTGIDVQIYSRCFEHVTINY